MKILFISAWYPDPINNGSKIRIYNLLKGLASKHQVHLLAFKDQTQINFPSSLLSDICQTIKVIPLKKYNSKSLHSLAGLFSSTPRSLIDTYSTEMFEAIKNTILQEHIDVVIASETNTAIYWQAFQGKPALFEMLEISIHDALIHQASTFILRLRHQLTFVKQKRYLRRLLQHYQLTTVVSANELKILRYYLPDPPLIEIIPNCVSFSDYQNISKLHEPYQLIFSGSFRYFANHDAMVWFLDQIYPLIQARIPEVQLIITGDRANLPLPKAKGVTLTGYVPEIKPYIANASISIVPIRLGGGTRLKILEAMALGTPVVSTSKGAEGLDVETGVHLFLADNPGEFAGAVINLLQNPELCSKISTNAQQLVEEKYNWATMMPRFLKLVEQVTITRIQ